MRTRTSMITNKNDILSLRSKRIKKNLKIPRNLNSQKIFLEDDTTAEDSTSFYIEVLIPTLLFVYPLS